MSECSLIISGCDGTRLPATKTAAKRGQPRRVVPHVIISAAARPAGLIVLHHDGDFERIGARRRLRPGVDRSQREPLIRDQGAWEENRTPDLRITRGSRSLSGGFWSCLDPPDYVLSDWPPALSLVVDHTSMG